MTDQPDAHPGVLLLVPDDFGSGAARIENQTVVLVNGRDVTDQSQEGVRVASQMRGLQVDVAGGAPGAAACTGSVPHLVPEQLYSQIIVCEHLFRLVSARASPLTPPFSPFQAS